MQSSTVRTAGMAAVLLTFSVTALAAQAGDPGRLFARVTTVSGSVFEGFVRWDKNEGHWVDVLDATKRLPSRYVREARALSGRAPARREIRILGIRVSGSDGDDTQTASSSLRFGHIARIQVLDNRHALLTLKSGEEQELRRSSTDLGSGMRTLHISAPSGRSAEFGWEDLESVEFLAAPADTESPHGKRMFGTVRTADESGFTGWVTWDMDEIFGNDVLDGDHQGRQKIPFSDIARIERDGSSRAMVTLTNGEQLVLRGTNDVNSGNNGIAVGDLGLGQVRMSWREFSSVDFHDPPQTALEEFDGGQRIAGTVRSNDGQEYTGFIRWDNDERWTWEMLDGEHDGLEFKVEFGLIRSIAKRSGGGVNLVLRDGRAFDLEDSNDVTGGNRGIFVTVGEDETVLVKWSDFERLDLR